MEFSARQNDHGFVPGVIYSSSGSQFGETCGPKAILLLRNSIMSNGERFPVAALASGGFQNSLLCAVCISRTVEVLEAYCFAESLVDYVTFEQFVGGQDVVADRANPGDSRFGRFHEPHANLTRIESCLFFHCHSLRSICIPPSVHTMDAHAVADSGLCAIQIAEGNRHFRTSGFFLSSFDGRFLVHYFGRGSAVEIPREAGIIGNGAFHECSHLSKLEFPTDSQLRRIERFVLSACPFLEALCISSFATTIAARMFWHSGSMAAFNSLKEIAIFGFRAISS
jgi:hypothetical protein